MKILILGSDGYLGWPLINHLLNKGHEVFGIDAAIRRERVRKVNSESLTRIGSLLSRKSYLREKYKDLFLGFLEAPIGADEIGYVALKEALNQLNPDTIVHLAEQPSAPWSMQHVDASCETQLLNISSTLHILWAMREVCPETHLVKIGTMGEYGTPDCDIPEGEIPIEPCETTLPNGCPMKGLPFPKSPGSFYHLSKVHDTNNIIFACKNWNLRSTDIMQGVVFGVKVTDEETEPTRFDYDQYFGTVINRFCAQAIIGHPLTIYGSGLQKRGFLPLKDSIQCLTIAIENPPKIGEYKTLNQFENIYNINMLADNVVMAAGDLGLDASMSHIKNPRKEAEEHYYNPMHQKLFDLGYKPTKNIYEEIRKLLIDILPYKDRVIKEVIMPTTNWR